MVLVFNFGGRPGFIWEALLPFGGDGGGRGDSDSSTRLIITFIIING